MTIPTFKMNAISGQQVEWTERVVAVLFTATLVVAHFIFIVHVGALWRDEVNTINVVSRPTFEQFWAYLKWDSCPPLWPSLLRLWIGLGFGGVDSSLRVLGLSMGLAIIAALWWNAKQLAKAVPLCSLVLLAASPAMILYGDSLRAYGLGNALMILSIGVVWRVVDHPTPARILLATVVCLLSVHALYYNSVLLFAICMGGAVVGIRHRDWKRPVALLGMGFLCALSLYLPYHERIAGTNEWTMTLKIPINVAWLLFKFYTTVKSSGHFVIWIWFALLVVTLHFCIRQQLRSATETSIKEKDLALFVGTTLVLGITVYFLFLLSLSYVTEPWYYTSIMGFMAALFDISGEQIVRAKPGWRLGRLGLIVSIGLLISPNVYQAVHTRFTNVNLIAEKLEAVGKSEDLIVVCPWYMGITFMRYYHGQTPWITLPLIEDHLVDRRDLIKKRMTERDAIRPILEKIAATIQSGHHVWFVGTQSYLSPGPFPRELPPPPDKPVSWLEWPHIQHWMYETACLFQTIPVNITKVDIPVSELVSRYEDLDLLRVETIRKEVF
ncbi:MAG: hypothetical protein U0V70_18215 [Terriglobia bacterium]